MVNKHGTPRKANLKLTRKQQRKEKRKEKKIRRHEFYTNRKKPGQFVLNPDRDTSNRVQKKEKGIKEVEDDLSNLSHVISNKQVLSTEQLRKKEQKEQKRVQKEMHKQRTKQLLEANVEEDRTIKQLEKQLKLNKRKSKSVPKTFAEDGLDYLLEVCDSDSMKSAVAAEKELNDVNNDFEEDFALMTGKSTKKKKKLDKTEDEDDLSSENDGDLEHFKEEHSENEYSDEESSVENSDSDNFEDIDNKNVSQKSSIKRNVTNIDVQQNLESSKALNTSKKRKKEDGKMHQSKKTKANSLGIDEGGSILSSDVENYEEILEDADSDISDEVVENADEINRNPDGTWEDIYGRRRTKDGTIINEVKDKYIPPAIRARLEHNAPDDKKRVEKLNRLKRQLKGLLNRLAESNMHSIASQIEDLYMNNSRNDMNDTLTNLMLESLVSYVIVPERLLIEHVVLVTILHANVGTEVGAHFLQVVVKRFDEYLSANHDVENKMLDNVVNVLSQLYNFKLFDAKLLYEILYKLSDKFKEKDVECILHILKNVGFTLRKNDPLLLKNLIVDLQKRAASASTDVKNNPRVKFMLDILLAIKNNNVTKIPNYDTSYSEHLKKIMKGFIRKGNYVTQLNISLEDLLKADERGRWWVVGSAWTGNIPENNEKSDKGNKTEGFSEKLLELARQQRMNTDTRRNIFCIIMSAEDYLDAFEKLLRLGLKNQQDREIINVILHCCLREKNYNPYYAVLAQKFCEYDRKYQMTIKCSVWDKLKSLNDHSGSQISNLAKMLTHLFIEKGLPISTLKIVQFSELDKVTLRFIRQILLGILLNKDVDSCLAVFEKVAQSDKLKLFRESLRLFIHHFLLRNLKSDAIPQTQRDLLEIRAKMVEKILVSKDTRIKF